MRDAKTEDIRSDRWSGWPVDATDRKILAALTRDAGLSFAALGAEVNLSAPAVHERVKRLRASGALRGQAGLLDPGAVGKPMLAFVHVNTTGWGKSPAMLALADYPEVEEIHSSTGDTCLILKVRVASSRALESLLALVYDVEGVTSTRTYLALSTYLERVPQAGVTEALEVQGNVK